MTIDKIAGLRNFGVFRDFDWPSDLHTFARFNLVYGWNGTGKSTLSRMFRDMESRRPCATGTARVIIDGQTINSDNFPETTANIRVFNQDFIASNVHRTDGENIPPILVLGETNVNQQVELEQKEEELTRINSDINRHRQNSDAARTSLNRHLTNTARTIKSDLSSNAYTNFNNYDRRDYERRAKAMVQADDASTHCLAEADRRRLKEQFLSNTMDPIDLIQLPSFDFAGHDTQIDALLSQSVTNIVINVLRDDAVLGDWVRKGLALHVDRNVDTCLFCNQSLPSNLINSLASHFNDAFDELSKQIDNEIKELQTLLSSYQDVDSPDAIQLYPELKEEFDAAKTVWQSDAALSFIRIDNIIAELTAKNQNMFGPIARESECLAFDPVSITDLNAVLSQHNTLTETHGDLVRRAGQRLEANWVATNVSEYQTLVCTLNTCNSNLESSTQERSLVQGEIEQLRTNLIDQHRPANEFNAELEAYLGHDELQLRSEEVGYAIVRNGERAQNISEGEKTAIALLYFLKSLDDIDNRVDETIVVFDDPISSLDSNALYAAYGLIRARTQNAKQLFLFTHNFVFFKEFRGWFQEINDRHRNEVDKSAALFMLRREFPSSGRRSVIGSIDPLLRNFESDYHFLFWCVYDTSRAEQGTNLQRFYPMPNITRRMLEMFLSFKYPNTTGRIGEGLDNADVDEPTKRQIMRFTDVFSHGDEIGAPGHDPALLEQTPTILRATLNVIKGLDLTHYQRMVRAVNRNRN